MVVLEGGAVSYERGTPLLAFGDYVCHIRLTAGACRFDP